MNDLPKRKQIRLKEYDYSQNGYYFITICTKDKKSIFWNCDINCRGGHWPPVNENGNIPKIYGGYNIDKYVIMPNHIHFILIIARGNGRPMTAPTVWQKSYYEHIIRNKQEYQKIYEYIENNPLKWELDCYYKL